jgi:hypothetical protein
MTGHTNRQASPSRLKFGSLTQKRQNFVTCMRTMTGHTDRQASPVRLKFGSLTQKPQKILNFFSINFFEFPIPEHVLFMIDAPTCYFLTVCRIFFVKLAGKIYDGWQHFLQGLQSGLEYAHPCQAHSSHPFL